MRKTCWLAVCSRAAFLVLLLLLGSDGAGAQTPRAPGVPLKEVDVGTGAFSVGDAPPSWVDLAAMPEPSAVPASLRLADTQYFAGGDQPVVYVRRALTVNDAAALSNAGQIPIPFVPDYQRLQLHTVRILRGSEVLDQTRTVKPRFLQRETGLERGVYSGEVTASILVSDVRVGDTVEYSYSLFGQNPVFGRKFVAAAGWDGPLPTGLRRVTLKYPADRKIAWRFLGDDRPSPLSAETTAPDGMHVLTFQEYNMPGTAAEPLTPPDYQAFRWLQFSEFTGWDDVIAWARGLFQSSDPLGPELLQAVGRLRGLPTEEERIAGALEFVQSEIRYFSVSLGESSHRPAAPNAVFRQRYGDCKDKSFLLISLLKELGIASQPALLKINGDRWLEKTLPSPLAFDHVIVQVATGGQTYYLDPTRLGQHGRLARMGQPHEGTMALPVAADVHGPVVITTPNAAELVHNEVAETVTLPKLGPAGQFQIHQLWNGAAAEAMRVWQSSISRDQMQKSVTSAIEMRYAGAKLAGDPQIEDDRTQNVFAMTARFDVPNLATEKDGAWFIRYVPSNMRGALSLAPSGTRRAPLAIPAYPFESRYSFEATFPDTVSAVRDPVAKSVESKYFTYTTSMAFRGNVSKTVIELKTLADRVPAAELAKFTADVKSIDDIAAGAVIVTKSDIKSDAASSAFGDRIRARVQEAIDKTTETIKGGKISGGDLADTYCARASSYAYIGKQDEAMQDIGEAMKLAPNSATIASCRGYLYMISGAFAKSIADYNRAVTLGAADSDVFKMRGMAKFYSGRLEEAAEDFTKASKAGDKETRLYTDLWLMWTYERLKKPIPPALAESAGAEPQGDWPRPALAMFAGKLTPEDVLKGIEAKSGDEREMARAEGFFYVGQLYFARGDKDKARELFEKTRAMGVLPYVEHISAGFELQTAGAVR